MTEEAKPVIINWLDCCYNSGNTYTLKELADFKLADLFSIGWAIEKDDSWIIYNEYNPGEEIYRHIVNIPKSGIVKITYLQEIPARGGL